MSDGGYPVIGGEASGSPLPAEYGSLDAGWPPAPPDPRDRRRAPATAPAAAPAPAAASARGGAAAPPEAGDAGAVPVRPSPRRAPRPAPPSGAPGRGAPLPVPPGPGVPGPETVEPRPSEAPATRRQRDQGSGPVRYADADVLEGPVRGRYRRRQKVRVVRGVRSKRLVRRIDVWTVLKVSFVFYLLVLVSLVAAGVIVWNVAAALGFIHTIEKSIRTLFSLKTVVLHPRSTLLYGSAIGGVLCLLGVIVNVLVAVAYNLISDLIGGLQVVVVTEVD